MPARSAKPAFLGEGANMAIYVISGTEGPELWEVDTDKRTVRPLSDGSEAGGIDDGYLQTVKTMRKSGFAVVKGVNFAVAVPKGAELTSRQFTVNG
jgi:hypothetical protein